MTLLVEEYAKRLGTDYLITSLSISPVSRRDVSSAVTCSSRTRLRAVARLTLEPYSGVRIKKGAGNSTWLGMCGPSTLHNQSNPAQY